MTENITESKRVKRQLPRKPKQNNAFDTAATKEFREFLAQQASQKGREIRKRLAGERVKDLLEHQLLMLRLTRQMNKLLGELHTISDDHSEEKKSTTAQGKRGRKSSKTKKSNEYVIFSGGPKGLEYTSLTQSETGTFRMEIDVSGYSPENLHISTENNKTMHVKALTAGVRKTLKIISPDGIDVDDIIIHFPKKGILLLEAP